MKKYYTLLIILFLCLGGYLISSFIPKLPDYPIQESSSTPKRIISINPAATEIIYSLGCQNRLVGISAFCTYPPDTQEVVKVGGTINPNFEQINALRPDLIILQGQFEEMTDFCEQKNIEYINLHLRNIEEIYHNIKWLGEKLQCPNEAEALCNQIREELEEITIKVSLAKKKKVFFSLYRTPGTLASITTVGPETYLNELINIAGGINVFDDVKQGYPVISKESLLKRQPEVIIESCSQSKTKTLNETYVLNDWRDLKRLNAVENKNIHVVDSDLVLKPGPRVAKAALMLAKLIHPEVFDE